MYPERIKNDKKTGVSLSKLGRSTWQSVRLGDVCEIISGGTPATHVPEYWDGDIPWCTPTDITASDDRFISRTARNVTLEGVAHGTNGILPKGTLLMCSRATIGEVKIAACPITTNQGFKNLICHECIDNIFFYYLSYMLKTQMLIRASGSTFLEISKSQLASIPIRIPFIDEQRTIASALSAIDAHISSLRRLIAKQEAIKKATLKLLLKPRADWKTVKLGDVGDVLMCKRILKSQTSTSGDVPFYKIGTFGKQADAFISRELFNDFRARFSFPKCGDILLSAAGTIGRMVVFDGQDAYFQDSNIVWIGNDEKLVTNEYLYYCYSVLTWQTEDGGIVTRLYNGNLKAMKIFIPPTLAEQHAIARTLTQLDNRLEVLQKQLTKIQQVKVGAMRYFFG